MQILHSHSRSSFALCDDEVTNYKRFGLWAYFFRYTGVLKVQKGICRKVENAIKYC